MSKSFRLSMLLGLFVAVVIVVNLTGAKTTTIFENLQFSIGQITFLPINFAPTLVLFPLTFFILDAVSETYGKAKAREFMYVTLIVQVVVLAFVAWSVWLPPSSRFSGSNDTYVQTFSSSLRITLASLTAYFFSQLGDIFSFFFLREKTKGKFLWLRSDVSTAISQFIDTFLFMFLAFYMLTPKYTFWFVVSLAIPYYLLKIILAVFGTPVVYALAWWLKRGK